jgi:polysaccharide pyruvyl transferase WcaK-like protein
MIGSDKVIFLEHGEAYGNLGDDSMLMSAISRLRAYLDECHFRIPLKSGESFAWLEDSQDVEYVPSIQSLILSEYPRFGNLDWWTIYEELKYELWNYLEGVNQIEASWPAHLTRSLKGVKLAYFVGAANLNDYALQYCVIPKCLLMEACLQMGIPIVISSQTCAPLDNHKTRDLVKNSLQHANFVSFRDRNVSKSILDQNWAGPELLETGDEAFSLPAASSTLCAATLSHFGGVERNHPLIAFHFRATDYTKLTDPHLPKIVGLLNSCISRWDARIIAFGLSYHSGLQDNHLHAHIRSELDQPDRFFILDSQDPTLVKGIVGKCDLAVGLSYHLHVFASSQNIPILPLSSGGYYRQKLLGWLAWYHMEEFLVGLDDQGIESIWAKMESLKCSQNEIRDKIMRGNEIIARMNHLPVQKAAILLGT